MTPLLGASAASAGHPRTSPLASVRCRASSRRSAGRNGRGLGRRSRKLLGRKRADAVLRLPGGVSRERGRAVLPVAVRLSAVNQPFWDARLRFDRVNSLGRAGYYRIRCTTYYTENNGCALWRSPAVPPVTPMDRWQRPHHETIIARYVPGCQVASPMMTLQVYGSRLPHLCP